MSEITVRFEIESPPRTKKTSNRIVRIKCRDGRTFQKIMPSKAYMTWFKAAMRQVLMIRTLARDQGVSLPLSGPVHVSAVFYRDADRGDLTGYEQALADFLQEPLFRPKRNGAGVIRDDRQVVSWDGSRLDVDRSRPRIEVMVRALGAQQEILPLAEQGVTV